MSDFRLVSKPALSDRTPIVGKHISLEALPEGHVILVMGKPGAPAAETQPVSLSDGQPNAVRTAGPGQWLVVGDQPRTQKEIEALFTELGADIYGVDQSAGRVRILVHGTMVERVLGKGTSVDLAATSFPVGSATVTLIGHIATHMTRTDVFAFELMVLRGFAESLWDDLLEMCKEFA
ncbi:sarcosine oxidase subunit gamma [Neorhizobium lilium]|uniref:Sarcosine oxidase subunit gamma n=1 Tax=Neorhizobium lilium TaxID=2503024 RepID=A0A3S4UUY3_9HYPH|nr:sarcosine oxidase subunit gamma family protein [Neorhizobium lilium]RWX81407.1 sarcosine oxidase subunit gamma [Neorhizobium lilium]